MTYEKNQNIYIETLSKSISMPEIPRVLIENELIREVLHASVDEFNFEEQNVIFLYCFVGLTVCEIVNIEELSIAYVASVLVLYSERLRFKLTIFQKAIDCSKSTLAPIEELFDKLDWRCNHV